MKLFCYCHFRDIQDISNYLTEIEQKKGDGLRYFGNLLKTYYSVD